MANPNEDDLRVGREIAQRFIGSGDNIIQRQSDCANAIASMRAAQREKDAKIAEFFTGWKRFRDGDISPAPSLEAIAAAIRAGNESQAGEKE